MHRIANNALSHWLKFYACSRLTDFELKVIPIDYVYIDFTPKIVDEDIN